jgi:mono/diheme cytochrome c family protein
MAAALSVPAIAQTPLERGKYLEEAVVACGNCHTPKGPPALVAGKLLAGGFVIAEAMFTARVPNITPDKETGIGNWTDRQIIDGIRHGVRPDGSVIGPPMPIELYARMADEDARAIVAYLRQVKPVQNRVAKSEYKMPLHAPPGPAPRNVAAPPKSNKVAYGAYIAGPLAHCVDCHTPLERGRRDFSRIGSGGFEMGAPGGGTVVTPNLTPDAETGLGKWTDAQIEKAIREGVRPDGTKLVPIMAFGAYRNMSAEDMGALIAYLRSLKPMKRS